MNLSPELRELALMARRQRHGETTPQQETASFIELGQRRARRKQRLRLAAGLASLSLCAGLALAFWFQRGAEALQYREQPLANTAGGTGRELLFSDGSRLTVEPDAKLEVDVITPHGAQLTLKRGRSTLAIAPHKGASWLVQAGPYQVRVTGTVFDVGWSEREGRLEVAMQHGAVVVSGPLAGAGVTLKAGQRLRATPHLHELAIEQLDALAAAAGRKPPELTEPVLEQRTEHLLEHTAELETSQPAVRARAAQAWSNQVSNGNFLEVLRQAKARGLARSLRERSASDLAALADAGRLANRNDVARSALLALRKRFPRSLQAQNAAFLLARLAASGKALEWYARYLQESPHGAYVSQAIGQSMLIHQQRSDLVQARKAASNYLARNPDGSYAAAARAILARPSAP